MARIPYPQTLAAEELLARSPVSLNVFRMIAHAPAVAGPAVDLGVALLSATALPPRLREAVVLSVAGHARCVYELAQHTPIAELTGMTAEQTAATAGGALHVDGFTQLEESALAAVRELMETHTLDRRTLSTLRETLGEQQTVELLMLIGYYVMLANLLNALDVDVDPASAEIAAAAGRSAEKADAPGTTRAEGGTL
ncbi:carboxymuconolactone decarboxylase family protein [Streptomyces sp. NRRL F-5123]|uniref:carboxymuconolactone decarboxylase family protein n=1 Tax=Streptomyces sp. NRRL F-5123 TaxID=1463856 RepID=UPI000694977E|nr:carboxymuconolactone decarboxylase family protein [Streptomyces sp. NRRL F-5123]